MALIAWICTTAVAGAAAGFWVLVGLCLALLIARAVPKDFLLSAYRARRLSEREFPEGAELLRLLSSRAGLRRPPTLYYVPSTIPNAFAVGGPGDSAIAVSDGLLRLLNRRQFAGVLAHEVSHVANRDLWIMGLADVMSRATAMLSYAGQFVLLLNLPLLLFGVVTVPWVVPLVLIFAPTIISLLQLALSRAREFEADRGAAQLTGDPMGLASAFGKLERRRGRFWEEILFPGRRMPNPSLLRTHPPTEERIVRLRKLAASENKSDKGPPANGVRIPITITRVQDPPRIRWTGVWY
jgi:heat shock protein HtpX